MHFARFATITTDNIPICKDGENINIGRFCVQKIFHKNVDENYVSIVAATSPIDFKLIKNGENEIIIPDFFRMESEDSIEHFANIFAFSNGISRTVSSFNPSIALRCENEDDELLLLDSPGIARSHINSPIVGSEYKIETDIIIQHLPDRMDGVALIIESISYEKVTGRFRDSIRLFERGFALAGISLAGPLSSFLGSGFGGYTKSEVENWIAVRDGVTHADRKDRLLFDSDVSWIVERTTQAMYDVLLNKTIWRSPDTGRRQVWKPPVYTIDDNASLCISKSSAKNSIKFKFFDEFRRFPMNFQGAVASGPVGWWSGLRVSSAREHLGEGSITVEE